MLIKSKKTGFTLIELMVVIVIIGILATLGLVTYQNSVRRARDSQRIGDMKDISSAQEQLRTSSAAGSYLVLGNSNANCPAENTEIGTDTGNYFPADPTNSSPYVYTCRGNASSFCAAARLEANAGGNCGGCPASCTSGICEPLTGTTHYCVTNKY